LSFDARDLAITLYPGERGTEAVWIMACQACATTGTEKPACQAPSQCQAPTKEADAYWTAQTDDSLALLRLQMKDALGRAG
jgi:hypothetical protein